MGGRALIAASNYVHVCVRGDRREGGGVCGYVDVCDCGCGRDCVGEEGSVWVRQP